MRPLAASGAQTREEVPGGGPGRAAVFGPFISVTLCIAVSNTCENICCSIMQGHTCQSSRSSGLDRKHLWLLLVSVIETLVHECFRMSLVFIVK